MRILIIAHGFPPRAQGGAEIYAHAQAAAFARGGDSVFVITRESDGHLPEYGVRREHRDGMTIAWINNTFAESRSFEDTYQNDRIGAVAAALIDDFAPEVAHAHHLTCLSTTIVHDLAARGVPVFYTLHDYWLLCHRGQLLDVDLHVCAGPEPAGCANCLGAAAAAAPGSFAARSAFSRIARHLPSAVASSLRSIARRGATLAATSNRGRDASRARLDHMRDVTSRVYRFLAPSRHMRDRFVAFGINPSRITISEYGSEPLPASAERPALTRTAPLRLGFVGSLMVSKAPHLLIDACEGFPSGAVTVELFGEAVDYHGDSRYREDLAPKLKRPWVHTHGKLPHDRMGSAFARIDVLVVPSIWPENSPLVIREAFLAGVPVVASRIGGIPETVTDGINGLLFTPGSVSDLQGALSRLIDEPELLARLKRGIPGVRTMADDVAFTRGLYAQATAAKIPVQKRLAAVVLNYRTPSDTFLAARSLVLSTRPITDIIVVDNDVTGDCRAAIAPLGDAVSYLPTGANLGFSGGMNAGIREALARGAERVLVVNSDVIVPPDCLAALERSLDGGAGAGIAGPIVLARHAPDRVASMGMSYRRGTGRMRHRAVGERLETLSVPAITDVEGVSGCCMLVTRRVFDTIGLFDEDYFFGFEDLDFCLRARDAGFRTVVAGRASVLHEGGQSIGPDSPQRLYYSARNQLLMARRTSRRGTRLSAAARTAIIVVLNAAHAFRARGGSLASRLSAVARGTRDYMSTRLGRDPRERQRGR